MFPLPSLPPQSKKRSKVRFDPGEGEEAGVEGAAGVAPPAGEDGDDLLGGEVRGEGEVEDGEAPRPRRKKKKSSSYTAALRREDEEEGGGADGGDGTAASAGAEGDEAGEEDPAAARAMAEAAAAAALAKAVPMWEGADAAALPTPVPAVPVKRKKERHAGAEAGGASAPATPVVASGKGKTAAGTTAVAAPSAPTADGAEGTETPSAAAAHAKEYLHQWKDDKKHWKFKVGCLCRGSVLPRLQQLCQPVALTACGDVPLLPQKVRQTWILRHLYDQSQVCAFEQWHATCAGGTFKRMLLSAAD